MQKPIPQLNVLIISLSEILFVLIHLNISRILIFDKSIFNVSELGIDLNKFSIKPPPVI